MNQIITNLNQFLTNIQFAKPLFFWLLLIVPLLWFRFRDRRFSVLAWRTIILSLLVLTLADPQRINQQTKDHERLFAFDLSQSISPAMRSWMEKSSEENFAPTGQDRVFLFGSQVKEAADWPKWLSDGSSHASEIQPQKTDLEKLLTTVLALPAAPRSLFLFTDGWETQGNVERLLPSIAGGGLKIFPILPPDRPKVANVAVTKLLSPSYGNSGETVNLKVVLENYNERDVDGTLTLTRDGQTFKSEAVKLKPGSQIFSYQTTLAEGPLTAYRVAFTPRQAALDTYAPDNHAFTWITVRSKAKVLLLNGQSGGGRYLEEILKRQGFNVTSRRADSAPPPNGYGLIIFNNAEREKFSANYLAAIERHVADGNGFLMLGNEASFAPGSYRRTPIETILPVEPREPPKREEKNHAVVLVIDKSGSMREDNRILYAQAAAKAVARQLKDNDLLGVVGFDISSFVVLPVEPLSRIRGQVDGQIDRLRPGGQTYFYPALLEAKRQLERVNASRKHVILFSDGETRGSPGELVDLITVMKNEMKITVSTIAIGADADVRIMKRISQYGGGAFYQTLDPSTLPQIVMKELQDNAREEPEMPRDLTPVQERGSEILAGLAGQYPNLRGFMDTDLKRGARLDLMFPREDRKAPLMASWRYGRGKSVALTFDFEGRYSRNWIQWGGLQSFWEKTLNWLRPPEEAIPLHEARVSLAGNQPVLDLFVYEESSSDSQFRFSVDGKGGRTEGILKRLAPGHYQSILPLTSPGDYRIELTEDRRGRRIPLPPLGYTLSQDLSRELPQPYFNTNLLAKLAQTSGGEINPKASASMNSQEVTRVYTPMRQPLILLIVVLFMLEVGFRNLVISENS